MDVVVREALAALQEGELDHERDPDDLAAELLDEVGHRAHRAPGGEDVVVDEDAGAARERVGMELERVLPVLERVRRADGLRGQLAWSARRGEAAAEVACERAAEDETARLGAQDQV